VRLQSYDSSVDYGEWSCTVNTRTRRTPRYCLHKATGQAVVRINGRDCYLGKYDTPESRQEYDRVIAEWLSNGRHLRGSSPAAAHALTVAELILAHWQWAVDYYRWGERGGACLKDVLRILKELYGHTMASEFGPRALKTCRQRMIDQGWSRGYVNSQVNRLRRVFRWAASEELLPGGVLHNLRAVEGLKAGRTEAREGRKIRPVPDERVQAILPYLPNVVRAMVRFEQLTGARPTEVCLIRPIDIDMRIPACWVYRPGSDQGPHGQHKTAHHGHDRLILIGPRAQDVLRPYLGTKLDAYCFSPRRSEAERNTMRRSSRRSPITPSQAIRKTKRNRKRPHRDHYDVTSYRNAIYRACDKAFPPSAPLARQTDGEERLETRAVWRARLTPAQKEEIRSWQREHRWHPNQLRHNRATELRSHGLDVTKTILGHSKIETTQVYAEKDMAAAMDLVSKIG
jgi:integrase